MLIQCYCVIFIKKGGNDMKINVQNLKTIFQTCIDFEKEDMLPEYERKYTSEVTELRNMSKNELLQYKELYEKKLKEIERKILKVHFKMEKSNEKVCLISQGDQRVLRSRYWFCKKVIHRIKHYLSIKNF